MKKIYALTAHGVKGEKPSESIFSKNHFASSLAIPRDVQFEIDSLMLRRIAGNIYEAPSTRDFWKVQGNKIVKLVGNEVDNGESIPAAPEDKPAAFLAGILDDLEF